MDGIRQWWGNVLKASLAALAELWNKLAAGITSDWNVGAFILVMAVVVIVTAISMWRRRA